MLQNVSKAMQCACCLVRGLHSKNPCMLLGLWCPEVPEDSQVHKTFSLAVYALPSLRKGEGVEHCGMSRYLTIPYCAPLESADVSVSTSKLSAIKTFLPSYPLSCHFWNNHWVWTSASWLFVVLQMHLEHFKQHSCLWPNNEELTAVSVFNCNKRGVVSFWKCRQ